MEFGPVALTTVLVALAGPLAVALGWWLGRRGERERTLREERKEAYIAFVHAAFRFRFCTDEQRREIRDERWGALARVVLVAPPPVAEAASYQVSWGERLLEPGLGPADRQLVYAGMWERNRAFMRAARTDLNVGDADPWEGIEPIIGERVDFKRRTDA
ncbi:MAG TPA: hypothetical protein VGK63_04490 [Candidatus Limnocylindrales bacterium]